jgi:hypothetical protein
MTPRPGLAQGDILGITPAVGAASGAPALGSSAALRL